MMFELSSFNLINEFERASNEPNAEQLGSVTALALINSVFTLIVGTKMGCHFNNSIFFIKKYN